MICYYIVLLSICEYIIVVVGDRIRGRRLKLMVIMIDSIMDSELGTAWPHKSTK